MALTRINNQALTNVTSAGLPSGSVLQVVSNEAGIASHSSGTTAWTTVVSQSITPKSTSSKILVMLSCPAYAGSEAKAKANFQILRGSTQVQYYRSGWYREATGAVKGSGGFMQVLDSPSTTSATTYYAQVKHDGSSSNLHLDDSNNGEWTITLMEIAG